MTYSRSYLSGAIAVLVTASAAMARADEPPAKPPLDAAKQLFDAGKYAEAAEAYRALTGDDAPQAASGLARCQQATGEHEKAVATLTEAARQHPKSAALPAELARLAFERGDHQAAAKLADSALAIDAQTPLAEWIRAEGLRVTGKLTEANAGYQRLVDYYNAQPPTDVEQLHWIGLAAAQYAALEPPDRSVQLSGQRFLSRPGSRRPTCWQAHLEAGRLFAEKYNQADAAGEFNKALTLNPNAAEVHVAVGQLALDGFEIGAAQASADRALEINPELLSAHHLKADIHLANFDPRRRGAGPQRRTADQPAFRGNPGPAGRGLRFGRRAGESRRRHAVWQTRRRGDG